MQLISSSQQSFEMAIIISLLQMRQNEVKYPEWQDLDGTWAD